MRTEVAIVGAGPAGLLLSHLLDRAGIESVVVETRSRDYVESRIRAGILESSTVELLDTAGLGTRLRAEGDQHHGITTGSGRSWPSGSDRSGCPGRSRRRACAGSGAAPTSPGG